MQAEIDWRHGVAAAVVLLGLAFAGWRMATRPSDPPSTAAPAGANRRMEDVPEQVQRGAPGAPSGLPTAQ